MQDPFDIDEELLENEEDLAALREIEREEGRGDKPAAKRQLWFPDAAQLSEVSGSLLDSEDHILSFFDQPQAGKGVSQTATLQGPEDLPFIDLTRKRERDESTLDASSFAEPMVPESKRSRSTRQLSGNSGKYSYIPRQGVDSVFSTDSRGRRVFIEIEDETAPPSVALASGPSRIVNIAALRSQAQREEEYHFFRRSKMASHPPSDSNDSVESLSYRSQSELWVDKYAPKSFLELLSDEKSNRNVLSWLKEWDGVVFNKDVKPSSLTFRSAKRGGRAGFQSPGGKQGGPAGSPQGLLASLSSPDKRTRDGPSFKTILIAGNPGIGKTTLAKIISRHCGYEPVEFNASDDRGAASFLPKVLDVVENTSVFEEKNSNGSTKSKCLIIDEIDGVVGGEARGAIKGLIDLIDQDSRTVRRFGKGTNSEKPVEDAEPDTENGAEEPETNQNGGNKKKSAAKRLRRPIICICNDPWVPALRPLREKALVLRLEPPSLQSLLSRLQSVCQKEGIRADTSFLQALSELTNRDIRACLNTLQFLSSQSKILSTDMLSSAAIGSKDIQTSVFDIWRAVFLKEQKSAFLQHVLQQSTRREAAFREPGVVSVHVTRSDDIPTNPTAREQQLFNAVAQADLDRVLEGCWENYPAIRYSDPLLAKTAKSAEWFGFVSLLWKEIRSHQMFGLTAYLPAAAVALHHNCSVSYLAKPLQPPRLELSFRPRREHIESIVKSFKQGISPELQPFCAASSVSLDLLPLIPRIAVPSFRPVAPSLLEPEEKKRIETLVSIFLKYGLQFVEGPSRDEDPHLFHLKPPINDVTKFDALGASSPIDNSSDIQRQILSQRMEVAKNNLLAGLSTIWDSQPYAEPAASVQLKSEPKSVPLLDPRRVSATPAVEKDFFGRVVKREAGADDKPTPQPKSNAYGVIFRFQEGFTNAVRRKADVVAEASTRQSTLGLSALWSLLFNVLCDSASYLSRLRS